MSRLARRRFRFFTISVVAIALTAGLMTLPRQGPATAATTSTTDPLTFPLPASSNRFDLKIADSTLDMIRDGRHTFRSDTFGDEAFWGQTLGLHKAIAGSKNGGVGAGVSPRTALAVGLKVDSTALPSALVGDLKANRVNLDDPAVTLALLKLDAVVGVKGFFDSSRKINNLGITCAFCHSTVDNSL